MWPHDAFDVEQAERNELSALQSQAVFAEYDSHILKLYVSQSVAGEWGDAQCS